MPYIKDQKKREKFDSHIKGILSEGAECAGDLNYVITRLLLDYLWREGPTYDKFNSVVGALECAKMELYRRHVVPYENAKMAENGDVTWR